MADVVARCTVKGHFFLLFTARPGGFFVADLVGDYLFTDSDFIGRLSTENRGLFQMIFDEVKYLCKVATAGSKEARQLEKVKKAFEDAYRTETKNPTGDGGVKYSLGDGTVKEASELSRSDLQYLLENAQNGELSDSSYIPLRRNTPEFFIGVVEEHSGGKVAIKNYPMAATVEHLRQNMEDEDGQSYGDTRPHGFTTDDIITISEKMGDPSYIVLQKNGRYAEVVTFYNKRNKQVVVAIDLADSNSTKPKNYKYAQYMNGYGDGYYNIVVTQYEPDNLAKYLQDNEVVYSKKEMNGRYQVGSGRIVTITHDTPFIEDIVTEKQSGVNTKNSLSSADDVTQPVRGGVYGRDVLLEGLDAISENTATNQDIADSELVAGLETIAEDAGVESQYAEPFPSEEDLMDAELREMDDAYRVQGEEEGYASSLYDSGEGSGVDTVARRLEVKRQNARFIQNG